MEEEKNSKKDLTTLIEQVNEQVERSIKEIIDSGLTPTNLDNLGKLVDIHKDLKNEEYWKIKEEMKYMRYRNYGRDSYGEYGDDSYERRSRDSKGRYTESYGEGYGKRGYDTKYRGHDMLDEMNYSYGAYSESNEYGNYGASADELEKMLDCNIALIEHLKKNAKSQEEIKVIDKKLQEMSRL